MAARSLSDSSAASQWLYGSSLRCVCGSGHTSDSLSGLVCDRYGASCRRWGCGEYPAASQHFLWLHSEGKHPGDTGYWTVRRWHPRLSCRCSLHHRACYHPGYRYLLFLCFLDDHFIDLSQNFRRQAFRKCTIEDASKGSLLSS